MKYFLSIFLCLFFLPSWAETSEQQVQDVLTQYGI